MELFFWGGVIVVLLIGIPHALRMGKKPINKRYHRWAVYHETWKHLNEK